MDPTTWPLWIKLLAGWGPLGVWAGFATYALWKTNKDYHATRDSHAKDLEKLIEKHEAAIKALADAFALTIKDQAEAFTQRLKEIEARYHAQAQEQAVRLHTVTDQYAERNLRLVEKVTTLVDAIGRHR